MKDQWSWQQALRAGAYLWWLEFCHQVFGYKSTPLQKHILAERAKMTRKLWFSIMFRDKWICQIRISGICTWKATQIDHKKPLARYGYTEPQNLQAACEPCNKWKGTKIL
jgi:5-methylcytosine-specific restriction endonuclease McrA